MKGNKLYRFYQYSWHGIEFSEVGQSSTDLPTKYFYDQFYKKFYEKHESFEDLDENWKTYKFKIAKELANILVDKSSILSIGCGIGYVENELTKFNQNLQITAIEPSGNAVKWIKSNPRIVTQVGYFPNCIPHQHKFDLVYANNIEYVFSDKEYASFLQSVVEFGITDFLVITSANYNLWVGAKLFLKRVLQFLSTSDVVNRGQLWGYLRTKRQHIKLLRQAGFTTTKLTKFDNNTLFIRAKK